MPSKLNAKSPTGCRPAQLFGDWYIYYPRLQEYAQRVDRMDLTQLAAENARIEAEAAAEEKANPPEPTKPYFLNPKGVAIIRIEGPTTKYPTSFQRLFGGTSTMFVERQLTAAAADPDVKGVMLHMDDAPGGTVAGAYELRDRIRWFATQKPITACISDFCASAGYLFAAAAGDVSANQTAIVGSIGTRARLLDTSEKYAKEGVKPIDVTSGKFKAAGAPGTPITPEIIAEVQNVVDGMNDLFISSVSEDRKLTAEAIKGMEARTFLASAALENKLIDRIESYDQAIERFEARIEKTIGGGGQVPKLPGAQTNMNFLQQLALLLGGKPEMSEAEAIAAIRQLQAENATLKQSQPKEPDPGVLADRLGIECERVEVAEESGRISPAQATLIKQMGGWSEDGKHKPVASVITPAQAGGKSLMRQTIELFNADNGSGADNPKADGKGKAKFSAVKREIPGEEEKSADAKQADDSADRAIKQIAGGRLATNSSSCPTV